jgi:hypothetical protein
VARSSVRDRRRAWRPRRSSGRGGVARAEDGSWGRLRRWRAGERHVGRRKQEVVLESLRRRAAARISSGRPRTTWRGYGVASAGSGKAAASGGAARGSGQSSAGAAGRRTWPGSGGGVRQRKNRGGRERGRRRGTRL